jgi:hypothetical protein
MHRRRDCVQLALALALVFAACSAGLLVVAPTARANHDTITWSDPFTVAGSPGFADAYPRVVADGQGNVYVLYIVTNTGLGLSNLNVTKYSLAGAGGTVVKGLTQQVNDVSNVVDASPFDATVDHSGNLYVAWVRDTVGLSQEIYVSKSVNGGATWLPSVLANAPNAVGVDHWPVITAAGDGTLYVAWLQAWGGKAALSVSKSTDTGGSFTSWNNATVNNQLWTPAIASDSRGRVYLAFGQTNEVTNVTWSDNGVTWAPWRTVTTTTYGGHFPALAVGSDGVVHLLWRSYYGSNQFVRYAQSVDRGASWSAPVAITGLIGGGFIGYLATEGDTVMYVWGSSSVPGGGYGYAISGDRGSTWYPNQAVVTTVTSFTSVAADHNGTFWAVYPLSNGIQVRLWAGPPSAPVLTGVSRSGSNGLTVSWTDSPERNVVAYQIWRSVDGSTYAAVATVGSTATTYSDSGLANGTYWYKIVAVNGAGLRSHESQPSSGVVGPTTQELIDNLESQIAVLQGALNNANANLTSLRNQLTSLQSQLASLQNSQAASNAATAAELARLQTNLTRLQQQLNDLQAAQATQTVSYANLAFEIIVVVLLVVLLLNQMRRPKAPQIMMAQPGQVAPKHPEDEL